jgi:hypothetical protein
MRMSAEDRIAIAVETGGDLSKDRTFFRFGKRVESILFTNNTSTGRLFDVQVARDPRFYWPASPNGGKGAQVARTEIFQETYFYWAVPANSSSATPPFYARRGLKVKAQGSNGRQCFADALVYGVEEGECTTKGSLA